MTQKPYLNLGCGRVILPAPKPAHHALVPDAIYDYPYWHNVDRNQADGVDECVDLFTYPWPLESDSYDGALLSHLCEHIPHEIRVHELITPASDDPYWARYRVLTADATPEARRRKQFSQMQDGWFAFFAELYRVLTPGAMVYILSPYAWSYGAINDPSHTRLLTPDSFNHSMRPDPDAPFAYETGGLHFEMRDVRMGISPDYIPMAGNPDMMQRLLNTQLNVASEFYVRLECIK